MTTFFVKLLFCKKNKKTLEALVKGLESLVEFLSKGAEEIIRNIEEVFNALKP